MPGTVGQRQVRDGGKPDHPGPTKERAVAPSGARPPPNRRAAARGALDPGGRWAGASDREPERAADILEILSDDPLAPHSLSAQELRELLSAERAGAPFLAYRDQRGLFHLFVPDRQGQTVTVGRREELDLSIGWDPEVSGLHAELHCVAGEWTILDDGLSMNGTHVNGRRVAGRLRLRDGDRIRVGGTIIAFREPGAKRAQETLGAAELPAVLSLTDTQRRVLVALCRPYRQGGFATPATNQQIANEVFLSVDAVKTHLRTLFGKFALGSLPQNSKRARLAERALQLGVISPHELD
jgi:DNA-binding CsgD family transcriptional regulator